MAYSLEKYAEFLEERGDPAPLGPAPAPFHSAQPHLPRLSAIRCVVWNGYGTLLLLSGGTPHLLNPDATMRKIALEKTIHEFKMWQSMTRKPGEPSKYMETVVRQVADRLAMTRYNAPHCELRFDAVWAGVLGRLFQKEYSYDTGFYGELGDYCQKITYYYLRVSQGAACVPQAAATLRELHARGVVQGVHADGQCNLPAQLWRSLVAQESVAALTDLFDPGLLLWSFEIGSRKTGSSSFPALLRALARRGYAPHNVLYVGADVERDIAPANRIGLRTALALLDKGSTTVTPEQLKDKRTRPDCLLTEIGQVLEIV
jgi:FMN phosphatase YigB (HAD superfamily)